MAKKTSLSNKAKEAERKERDAKRRMKVYMTEAKDLRDRLRVSEQMITALCMKIGDRFEISKEMFEAAKETDYYAQVSGNSLEFVSKNLLEEMKAAESPQP